VHTLKNLLLLLLGLMALSTPLRAQQGPRAHELASFLRAQGLHGAVWSTLESRGAAGVSNARSGALMRADHRVQVGSVAKTVLAAGILRLVSERRLSLDTPVAMLLPGLRFDNPWAAGDPVRIRHLLDHTSGLDDARLWQVFSMRPAADAPLKAAFPEGRGLLRIRQRPGTRFSYSNMGYTLLGMVIEAVTGQAYERYLDAALLAPLGMQDSSFAFVSQDRDPRLAMGHFDNGVPHPALPSYVRPAGQFTTTAADMARFARFLMSDGRIAGTPFIDAALLHRMGEPTGTDAARAGLRVGYGLGLRTVDQHGALAKCHSGNTVGFRAMLCLFPQTQQAFFIAINTDSETADYQSFDALFTRALAPSAPPPVPVRRAGPVDTRAWRGFYLPAPSRFESLRFADVLFGFLRVDGEGGVLRLAPFQAAEVDLRPVGDGLFRAPGKLLASHVLLAAPDGTRLISNGIRSWERVAPWRVLLAWASVAAGILGLAYVLVAGSIRLGMRRMRLRDPLLPPFAGALLLLLPIPFFYRQSFLQLGDLTVASGLLAAATTALPAAMLAGLALALHRKRLRSTEAAAMLAILQLCLVLAAWGLLPLRLWA
jgi:CubicO group peptidase (beta-lactamase class C family)